MISDWKTDEKRVLANRYRNGDNFWWKSIIRIKNVFEEEKEIGDDFLSKATYIDEKWYLTNKDRIGDDFWWKVKNADEKGFLANEDRIGQEF